MSHLYHHAILGGTFDHFHLGHENFITTALSQAEFLTIGIVKELFTQDKLASTSIEDYLTRQSNLKDFLHQSDVESRVKIIPITDIYGTSLTDSTIEAIYVTKETKPNAEIINAKRQGLDLAKLALIVLPYSLGDDNEIISSSRIRAGIIDRQGHSFLEFITQKSIYHLPESLRSSLQIPLGTVVTNLPKQKEALPLGSFIISVGDIVSIDLQKAGYIPSVSIVDYHTRRHGLDPKDIERYFPVTHATISNPRGVINSEFANIFQTALGQPTRPQIIAVEGEEDLLALPTILLSPLGSYVIYGQYDVGMCIVKIDEAIKTLTKSYLEQFT
ncbi:MAG: pantetheine-phosphate adenylyltransferase [bacterium]